MRDPATSGAKFKLATLFANTPCKFQHPSFRGCGDIMGGVKIAQKVNNRVKKFSHSQKIKITSDARYLARLKVAAKKEFRNDLWPNNVFCPIGRNANAKFKVAPNFFGDRYQKSVFQKALDFRPLQAGQVL